MKLNKFKKEIIEFFQSHKPIEEGVYESDLEKFEDQFGKDSAYTKNLDTLIANGIINKNTKADRVVLTLFERDHQIEIRKILNFEKLEDLALIMQPSVDNIKNLHSRFYEFADQNRSNGVYYFYTEKNDPDCWIVLARVDAKKEPYRYRLGSIKDSNSKIYQMWVATVQAWNGNGKQAINRGMAEKIDQDSFGNNRQPGFAAFKLFTHAGWLRIPFGKGTSISYIVTDEKAHSDETKVNQFTNNILRRWGFDDDS